MPDASARADLAARVVRTNPRPIIGVSTHETILLSEEGLAVIARRSLRRAACGLPRLFAARRHSVAFLDCKKLRVLRALRMTDRSFILR